VALLVLLVVPLLLVLEEIQHLAPSHQTEVAAALGLVAVVDLRHLEVLAVAQTEIRQVVAALEIPRTHPHHKEIMEVAQLLVVAQQVAAELVLWEEAPQHLLVAQEVTGLYLRFLVLLLLMLVAVVVELSLEALLAQAVLEVVEPVVLLLSLVLMALLTQVAVAVAEVALETRQAAQAAQVSSSSKLDNKVRHE
jgi:hypothetical protein